MHKMIPCPKCHTHNNINAKFCKQCGTELTQDQNTCAHCGAGNTPGARFCLNCGKELGRAKVQGKQVKNEGKRGRNKPPEKKLFFTAPGIAIIILLIVITYLLIPVDKKVTGPQPAQGIQPVAFNEQKLADPVMEARAHDIASRFICSCGKCSDELNICTCDVAQQERQVIRNTILSKKDPDSIVKEINEKYGRIKPEFINKYGSGKPMLNLDSKTLVPPAAGLRYRN